MHPQEERFEHIKDELEKAGIDFDEYRYEEGALEIFSSYSSLKKLAPWCLSRIHIEYERIIFRDEECIQFFREQRAEELRGHSSVNSTEKIQLVDSRTKFIQQLSYPPSLFLLIAILKRYSIPYVDNTSRGGAFWIDGDLDSLKWLIDGFCPNISTERRNSFSCLSVCIRTFRSGRRRSERGFFVTFMPAPPQERPGRFPAFQLRR